MFAVCMCIHVHVCTCFSEASAAIPPLNSQIPHKSSRISKKICLEEWKGRKERGKERMKERIEGGKEEMRE